MDAGVSCCRTHTVLRSRDRKAVNGVNDFSIGDHRSHNNGDNKTTETSSWVHGWISRLPLPQGFLGSGVDFWVGNVSFFLFFSGHVT
uniref:AtPDCT1/2 transmembrane domain-containing protein n=1 Tax=Nelumbo nucifera TaxID=4432 RepID=A0A822Z2Q5_NELNU|nr:TPA_asm: hypothetical protein HUJ06_013635 [Nelumbo nucifera]